MRRVPQKQHPGHRWGGDNGRNQREARDPELGAMAVVVVMISLWDARSMLAESNDGRKSRDVVSVWGRLGGLQAGD